MYFAVNATNFATASNFKTLLPYFAPLAILAAGEVFVMINGEIDLSIGAVYLFTPFIFYKLATSRRAAGPGVILSLLVSGADRLRSTASSSPSSASRRSWRRSGCCSRSTA